MGRRVIGQHGNDDVTVEKVSELVRRLNADRLKLGIARRLAEIADDGAAASGKIGRHGAAHMTEPDESNLHDLQLLMTLPRHSPDELGSGMDDSRFSVRHTPTAPIAVLARREHQDLSGALL